MRFLSGAASGLPFEALLLSLVAGAGAGAGENASRFSSGGETYMGGSMGLDKTELL